MQALTRGTPRLRGVFHQGAFVAALPLGVTLVLVTGTARGRIAAAVFAASVAAMFGASVLYHRPTWMPRWRVWLRRLDHAGIYCLIAGTYTPVGLLVLHGAWRIVVLAIVWSGASIAVLLKFVWPAAPKMGGSGSGRLARLDRDRRLPAADCTQASLAHS